MRPEEVETRTRLEQETGRNAAKRHFASELKDSRAAKRKYPPGFAAKVGPATGEQQAALLPDPNAKLPVDVQAAIARGETAFRESKRKLKGRRKRWRTGPEGSAAPSFITSVVDKDVQDRRDATLDALAQQSKARRGQPPMLGRLAVVRIIVDRLQAEGVRFATGRNSQMNRLVREWLNDRAARSRDDRKSRRKRVTADAVQRLLKQIKALG
jgi:hypothetical protein